MKTFLLGTFVALTTGVAAFAGDVVIQPMPETGGGDGTAGLVLLAMIGVVIATGSGAFASRNANKLDIKANDADDNAGF